MASSAFSYDKFDNLRKRIRLLEILPGEDSAPVACTLTTSPLSECPPYNALSYMWGPQDPRYEITVNGRKLTVGGNLHRALRNVRSTIESVCFWVDAICINQANIAERNHQVQAMADIYRGAVTVHACIEHQIKDAEEEELFRQLQRVKAGDAVPGQQVAFWHTILPLFANPYFSRVWIQQELVLVRHAVVHIDKVIVDLSSMTLVWNSMFFTLLDPSNVHSIDFESFATASLSGVEAMRNMVLTLSNSVRLFFHIDRDLCPPAVVLRERPGWRSWDYTSTDHAQLLLEMVSGVGGLDMMDQRDQVYGVLGLAKDLDPGDINVDYGLSLPQVYAQVCQHHLAKYSQMTFLGFWLMDSLWLTKSVRDSQKDVPSWQNGFVQGFGFELWEMSCAGTAGSTTASHTEISHDGRILTVRGFMVDKVAECQSSDKPAAEMSFLKIMSSLITMGTRVFPDFPITDLFEREEIVSLFYPWVDDDKLSPLFDLPFDDMPYAEQKTWVLNEIALFARWYYITKGSLDITLKTMYRSPSRSLSKRAMSWVPHISNATCCSTFFVTDQGRFGRIGRNLLMVEPGDQVWILFGSTLPIVLRPDANDKTKYKVVGSAVIPKLMNGEACVNITATGEFKQNDPNIDTRFINLC